MNVKPNTPEWHRARALELRKRGRLDEALAELERAVALRPGYAQGYFNIASIYLDQGRTEEAAEHWRKAIRAKPDYHQAYTALSAALRRLGRLDEAVQAARRAIHLCPDSADAHLNLATALHASWKMPDAAAVFEKAIQLDRRNISALNNYANLLSDMDQLARATTYYKAALAVDPNRAEIYNNLANVLKSQAQIDAAAACYRATLALKPEAAAVHSNLLLTLNCHPRSDGGLLAEHTAWADRHARPFYPRDPMNHPNDRAPHRRLRVGYVSADFRRHAVAYFFEPILLAHDHSQFEVFCYSNLQRPDAVTRRLRAGADGWRDIAGMTDERVARIIREDQIDILVDLSGHTAENRLVVFAHKPAPVQATYLGYPNTTGLSTIDYRLSDAEADPPGMTESHYTEQLVRLPAGAWCYRPPDEAPPARDPARTDPAQITFGAFNNFAKTTRATIGVWARILQAVPRAALLIKAEGLADPDTQQAVRVAFAEEGADPARVQMLGREPSFQRHLALYHRVDLALDTFPYNGTTTTCEAMWMGVPVITLAGRAHVSRVGASLLSRVGLSELIAHSPDEYMSIATDLARDPDRRRKLSGSMRDRMRRSPLMDPAAFARDLEAAYRQMWQTWCAAASATER